ncbi:integrase, catalytic region, zinc finger, CCHC-type containing protein [Tanacetum coccineum]|uniref:Integrase, catalytic region, zinc finger, CCHC-type containing protein n=1 Tax=Tanacetum coccineum TaxID=301880 RepID=A0ABQ4XGR5_9ASTR
MSVVLTEAQSSEQDTSILFQRRSMKHQTSLSEHQQTTLSKDGTHSVRFSNNSPASNLPLSFWAEALHTAWKPSIKHLHIFGCICYITRDGENLDKMKEKGDPCVMVGYSTQSKGYRVYKREGETRLIVSPSDQASFLKDKRRQIMTTSDPVPPNHMFVPTAEKIDSSQQGLEFLFSHLLEEYYNPTHGQAEENNNGQAPNASFQEDEFINPFCTRVQEMVILPHATLIIPLFIISPQSHDYRWNHRSPLEQVRGNPSKASSKQIQLAHNPECVVRGSQ